MANTLIGITVGDPLVIIKQNTVEISHVNTKVLETNPKRRLLILMNDSNQLMYVSFGEPAELHKGIRLEKNGGTFRFCHVEGVPALEVNAISSKPSKLLILEGE